MLIPIWSTTHDRTKTPFEVPTNLLHFSFRFHGVIIWCKQP